MFSRTEQNGTNIYWRKCLTVHRVYHQPLSWPYTHSVRKLSWPYTVSLIICSGKAVTAVKAVKGVSSSIICLHFTAYCTVACWGDELTYVADADAMLTGEGKGETNTNSLVVNEELMYHAMHTGEDYGGPKPTSSRSTAPISSMFMTSCSRCFELKVLLCLF